MGRSVYNGTSPYEYIDFLERRNAELEEEVERLRQCCTQRGARMQIMREWLDSPHGIGPPTEWWYFCEERPEAKGWFDEDGVPK